MTVVRMTCECHVVPCMHLPHFECAVVLFCILRKMQIANGTAVGVRRAHFHGLIDGRCNSLSMSHPKSSGLSCGHLDHFCYEPTLFKRTEISATERRIKLVRMSADFGASHRSIS